MNNNIKDKIKGIFFGQAIGDALGLGTEFLTKEQAKEYYPNGLSTYDQIVQDKHRSRWERGDWTDDTDQFLCIVDSLISKQQLDILDIANNFYKWYQDNPMGIGTNTLQVLSTPQYTSAPQKAAELAWKLKRGKSAPNGALMRNAIMGIFEFDNIEKVIENSEAVAELTHFDPKCKDSCKIMSFIIANELQGKSVNQNDLVEFIKTLSSSTEILDYIKFPMNYPIENLKLDDPKAIGFTLKALSAGLWSYYNSISMVSGIKAIVNECGDADTNACIAGSLLGAKFGYESFYNESPDLITELNGKIRLEKACLEIGNFF